jgi:hypothetical protein
MPNPDQGILLNARSRKGGSHYGDLDSKSLTHQKVREGILSLQLRLIDSPTNSITNALVKSIIAAKKSVVQHREVITPENTHD